MEERRISKAVIKRLPRYYRYLGEMLNNGVERMDIMYSIFMMRSARFLE